MVSVNLQLLKKIIRAFPTLFMVFGLMFYGCAGLPKFGAELGKKSYLGQEVRVPYLDTISYFGYIAPGNKPDEVVGGKKMYYLYIWVPVVAPEIGVRMISPVKNLAKPDKGDFGDPDFSNNANSSAYFDTWVRLERCSSAINPGDITKPCSNWIIYGENDDSSELPVQPSGNKYNSLLRVTSDTSNPLKALVRGMYRVGFTTFKVGEVEGTFLAQVGAPVKIPGTAIARNPEELARLVK